MSITLSQFRTKINVQKLPFQVSSFSKIALLGSCFSDNIGVKLSAAKANVFLNPFGTIFNPVSLAEILDLHLSAETFSSNQLFQNEDTFHGLQFAAEFKSNSKAELLKRVNDTLNQGKQFLKQADVLILTLGSAWAYRLNQTNQIVGNCHKLPNSIFSKELLSLDEMQNGLGCSFNALFEINPSIKIVVTVSPVRHIKDGIIENNLSKSRLIQVAHHLKDKYSEVAYFPSYEIMMDDLRDYRFYNEDMIHPSQVAIDYIWEAFKASIYAQPDIENIQKLEKFAKLFSHKVLGDIKSRANWRKNLLTRVEAMEIEFPQLKFIKERAFISTL